MSTISATQFFFNLGVVDGMTLKASTPIHKAWLTATPEQRKQLRFDCMAHYIMGKTKCTRKEADRILSQTRTKRSREGQLAYQAANERFTYHVSRDNKKVRAKVTPAPVQSFRISREARAAGNAFLKMFDDVETAIEALRALSK